MIKAKWLGVPLAAAMVTSGLAAQEAADAAEVVRVVESVGQAIQAADVESLNALYAADAWVRIVEGAGVNRGWVDYRDHHLKPELEAMQNLQYRYFDVEPQVRGDVAWASFRYELSVEMSGEQLERVGRGTMVLERRAGEWKIVHSHTSGRAPRPSEGGL